METINHKQLSALLKTANSIQGNFAKDCKGYQLIVFRRVPLKAGKTKVGERSEWHVVNVGFQDNEKSEKNPDTYLHASHGETDVLRTLFLEELKISKKFGGFPQFRCYPTTWYGPDNKHETATYRSDNPEHSLSGKIYTISFGGLRAYLSTAGICEESNKWSGLATWSTDEREDADSLTKQYEFVME